MKAARFLPVSPNQYNKLLAISVIELLIGMTQTPAVEFVITILQDTQRNEISLQHKIMSSNNCNFAEHSSPFFIKGF